MKMLPERYVWNRKSKLNFGSHADPESVSGSPDWIRLGGGLRSASVLVADGSRLPCLCRICEYGLKFQRLGTVDEVRW